MTLRGFIALRCPVCDRGKLFRGYLDTPQRCSQCGFFLFRESGYFLPHVAIGYGGTVLIALSVWPLLRYVFKVDSDAIILISMVTVAIAFGIWFIRYAKMIWLVFDLAIHPPTSEDFQPRGREQGPNFPV